MCLVKRSLLFGRLPFRGHVSVISRPALEYYSVSANHNTSSIPYQSCQRNNNNNTMSSLSRMPPRIARVAEVWWSKTMYLSVLLAWRSLHREYLAALNATYACETRRVLSVIHSIQWARVCPPVIFPLGIPAVTLDDSLTCINYEMPDTSTASTGIGAILSPCWGLRCSDWTLLNLWLYVSKKNLTQVRKRPCLAYLKICRDDYQISTMFWYHRDNKVRCSTLRGTRSGKSYLYTKRPTEAHLFTKDICV